MLGKLALGIKRAGKSSSGYKYKLEVEVLSLENLPAPARKCRVIWARAAKVSMTEVKEVNAKGKSVFDNTLTQIVTIFRSKVGFEAKEYEFKVQVPRKENDYLTIGKAKVDMSRYVGEGTQSTDDTIKIAFKVGSTTTGYLKIRVHSIFISETDDTVTVASGITGITSEGTNREQDLDGFDDTVSNSRSKQSKSKYPDESGDEVASKNRKTSRKSKSYSQNEIEEEYGDATQDKKPKKSSSRAKAAEEEELFTKKSKPKVDSMRDVLYKPAPKVFGSDEDISPISSDASDHEFNPSEKAAARRLRGNNNKPLDDMKASLFSSSKPALPSPRSKTSPGSKSAAVPSRSRSTEDPNSTSASSSKPNRSDNRSAAPPPPPVDDVDEDSLRDSLFSTKPLPKRQTRAPPKKEPEPGTESDADLEPPPETKPRKPAGKASKYDDDDDDDDDDEFGRNGQTSVQSSHASSKAQERAAPSKPVGKSSSAKPSKFDDDADFSDSEDLSEKAPPRRPSRPSPPAQPSPPVPPARHRSDPDAVALVSSNKEVEGLKRRISDLEAQLEDERRAKQGLEAEVDKLKKNVQKLEAELDNSDNMVELYQQMREMEEKFKREKEDIENKHLDELDDVEDQHKEEIENLKRKYERGSQEDKSSELEKRDKQVEALQQTIEKMKAEASSRAAEARRTAEEAAKRSAEAEDKHESLEEEVEKLKRLLSEAKDAASASSSSRRRGRGRGSEEDDEGAAERQKLEEANKKLNDEVRKLKEEIEDLKDEVDGLKDDLEDARKKHVDLEKAVGQQRANVASVGPISLPFPPNRPHPGDRAPTQYYSDSNRIRTANMLNSSRAIKGNADANVNANASSSAKNANPSNSSADSNSNSNDNASAKGALNDNDNDTRGGKMNNNAVSNDISSINISRQPAKADAFGFDDSAFGELMRFDDAAQRQGSPGSPLGGSVATLVSQAVISPPPSAVALRTPAASSAAAAASHAAVAVSAAASAAHAAMAAEAATAELELLLQVKVQMDATVSVLRMEVDGLHVEVRRLTQQRNGLQGENSHLVNEVDHLRDEIQELADALDAALASKERLEQENVGLLQQLERLNSLHDRELYAWQQQQEQRQQDLLTLWQKHKEQELQLKQNRFERELHEQVEKQQRVWEQQREEEMRAKFQQQVEKRVAAAVAKRDVELEGERDKVRQETEARVAALLQEQFVVSSKSGLEELRRVYEQDKAEARRAAETKVAEALKESESKLEKLKQDYEAAAQAEKETFEREKKTLQARMQLGVDKAIEQAKTLQREVDKAKADLEDTKLDLEEAKLDLVDAEKRFNEERQELQVQHSSSIGDVTSKALRELSASHEAENSAALAGFEKQKAALLADFAKEKEELTAAFEKEKADVEKQFEQERQSQVERFEAEKQELENRLRVDLESSFQKRLVVELDKALGENSSKLAAEAARARIEIEKGLREDLEMKMEAQRQAAEAQVKQQRRLLQTQHVQDLELAEEAHEQRMKERQQSLQTVIENLQSQLLVTTEQANQRSISSPAASAKSRDDGSAKATGAGPRLQAAANSFAFSLPLRDGDGDGDGDDTDEETERCDEESERSSNAGVVDGEEAIKKLEEAEEHIEELQMHILSATEFVAKLAKTYGAALKKKNSTDSAWDKFQGAEEEEELDDLETHLLKVQDVLARQKECIEVLQNRQAPLSGGPIELTAGKLSEVPAHRHAELEALERENQHLAKQLEAYLTGQPKSPPGFGVGFSTDLNPSSQALSYGDGAVLAQAALEQRRALSVTPAGQDPPGTPLLTSSSLGRVSSSSSPQAAVTLSEAEDMLAAKKKLQAQLAEAQFDRDQLQKDAEEAVRRLAVFACVRAEDILGFDLAAKISGKGRKKAGQASESESDLDGKGLSKAQLSKDLQKAQSASADLAKEREKLSAEVEGLQNKLRDGEQARGEQLSKLNQQAAQIEQLRTQLAELTQQAAKQQAASGKSKSKSDASDAATQRLKDDLAAAQQALDDLEHEKRELEEELAAAKEARGKLQLQGARSGKPLPGSLSDSETAQAVQALEAKYNKLKERYRELEDSSNEELEELQGQLEESQALIEKLERKVKELQAAGGGGNVLGRAGSARPGAFAAAAARDADVALRRENEQLVVRLVAATTELAQLSEEVIVLRHDMARAREINQSLMQHVNYLESTFGGQRAPPAPAPPPAKGKGKQG